MPRSLGDLLQSSFARSLGAGIAALLAYGGWALYVNLPHGMFIGWRSGLVQGTYSLVLTFGTTILMEQLYKRF
jgi:hypothetical protein